MARKYNSLWGIVVLLFWSFLFVGNVYGQRIHDIRDLREKMLTKNLTEIVDIVELMEQWPKIVSNERMEKLTSEEQQFQKEAHQLVEELLDKIRFFESQHEKIDLASLQETTETYAKLGRTLRSKQGYGNLVLTGTVYNLALSRLGFFLVQNPSKYEEVYLLWEKLERPFYDISVIADICKDELDAVNAGTQIRNNPNQVAQILGKALSEARKLAMPDDPMEMMKISYLIKNLSGYELVLWRMMATDILLEISIPGLVEFLKRGGKIEDLPGYIQDVRPYIELMDGAERKLRAEWGGVMGTWPPYLNLFPDRISDTYKDVSSLLLGTDEEVRNYASQALRRITGERSGADPSKERESREKRKESRAASGEYDEDSRVVCINNVRSLVRMCHMYAIDNDEVFPSSFADLEAAGYPIGDLATCPEAGDNAYGLNAAACARTSPADTPLMADFDSSNHNDEGGNIGYVDGSVRWHVGKYEAGSGPLENVSSEDWVRQ